MHLSIDTAHHQTEICTHRLRPMVYLPLAFEDREVRGLMKTWKYVRMRIHMQYMHTVFTTSMCTYVIWDAKFPAHHCAVRPPAASAQPVWLWARRYYKSFAMPLSGLSRIPSARPVVNKRLSFKLLGEVVVFALCLHGFPYILIFWDVGHMQLSGDRLTSIRQPHQ